jgi:hypothetical protein
MRSTAHGCRRRVARTRIALVLALLAGSKAAVTTAVSFDAPGGEPRWSALALGLSGDVASAVAIDRAGRFAVGDARGVIVGLPGGPMRRVALRGGVRDLAFWGPGREPVLLAATELGLYRVAPNGRVESIGPRPGADARTVTRIAVAGGVAAVATAAGAFVSADALHWQRISEDLPSGPASAVALGFRGEFVECWVALRGELWRSEIRSDTERLAVTAPVRIEIPFASGTRPPIEIALDVGAAAVAVVFDSELVVRGQQDPRWEQLRPSLPPGASLLRVEFALDRYWLATDRGLLFAADLSGPWRRAPAPPGSAATFDLDAGDAALYVATDEGVAVARLGSDFAAPTATGAAAVEAPLAGATRVAAPERPRADAVAVGSRAPDSPTSAGFAPREPAARAAAPIPQPVVDPSEPDIGSVHRAALRYLTLDPSRIAALREGVSRRGWLPIVSFRATRDRDRSRHSDYDEAFVSGEMRQLNDHDSDRNHELELQLVVSWDLGDIAYHPESIDVSREAREIIELRDDVLDEITQLYFERRRVLAALALQPDALAASELQLRAAQLAAGIDAWTGGWFRRQLSESTP